MCSNNTQTRTCADLNYCGVLTGKPSESQGCLSFCTPNWQCSTWSACDNNRQTRTCTDANACGIDGIYSGKPDTDQACVLTCSDPDDLTGVIDYNIKSTVSNSNGASFTDVCISSDYVAEGYCNSDGSIASKYIFCTRGCENGACKIRPADPVPSITVTSPNGGEAWVIGKTYTITWASSAVEKVAIYAVGSNNSSNNRIATDVSASTGTYSWTIPLTFGQGNYKIVIKELSYGQVWESGSSGESNGYVSIVSSAGTSCTDSDGGINYYAEGVGRSYVDGYESFSQADKCRYGYELVEVYCNGVILEEKTFSCPYPYVCEYGSGACKLQPSRL